MTCTAFYYRPATSSLVSTINCHSLSLVQNFRRSDLLKIVKIPSCAPLDKHARIRGHFHKMIKYLK